MNKVFSNMLWRFLERCGAQGVSLIVSVILSRLLDPDVYGTVALVTVITAIIQVFVDGGLGNALIQKKDADDLDFSSVFIFNMIMCALFYLMMYICAPLFAGLYKTPELTPIIRVLGVVVIISGIKNIQQAYVSRNLLFKKFFFSTMAGTIIAAIVGIVMAYLGFGVWALVAQTLVNNAIDTFSLWFTVNWRPKCVFSFERLRGLFSFGWKLLASALLDTIYNKLRQVIIGKKFTKSDLAFYNQGDIFPQVIVSNINTSVESVLLPVMSSAQDSTHAVRDMTRRAIKVSTYVIMPCMVGVAVCAEPIVKLMLTDKWLPCVFFLRIFCFSYAFWPIHTANLNAIKAMGRSDLFLILEIVKKVVGLISILITMWISVEAMALSILVTSILSQIINSFPNAKLLNYHYGQQVLDMLPQILLSAFMGVCVYCVQFLGLSSLLTLIIQVPVGVAIYFIGSKAFHIDSYEYVLKTAKGFLRKH